jgi:hypothetical protein
MTDNFEEITNDQSEWDNYEAPSEFRRPPIAGTYTLMRDQEGGFKAGVAVSAKVGTFVWYNFRSKVQGGDNDGSIVFGGCNTMVSSFRNGTTVQDYIRSAKSSIRPTSAELLKEAKAQEDEDNKSYILETVAGPFTAKLDWEFRCKECELTFLKGYKNPKSPKKYDGVKVKSIAKLKDGTTNHIQVCPNCNANVGANANIVTFVVSQAGAPTPNTTQTVDSADLAPVAG